MTVTDPAPLVCPQCGSTNTDIGGSGNAMCFECAHLGPPETFTATAAPALAPYAMKPTDEVFDAGSADVAAGDTATGVVPVQERTHPPAPADIARELNETPLHDWWSAPALPKEPPNPLDYPPTWAGLQTFRKDGGSMREQTWYEEIMGSPPDDIDPVPELTPEPNVEIQAVMLLAAQIIAAGIVTAHTMGTPGSTLVPPTGYLPKDKAMLPIVEQACAVAIGMVIDAGHDELADYAEAFGVNIESATTGAPTTEETDGEGTTKTTN